MIQRIINGTIYEFPEGTPEGVMRRFEAQKTGTTSQVPPATPARQLPNPALPGAMGHALQGLSMGFSDEAIAKMRQMMGQGKYEDLVAAEREGLRKYGEEHPMASGLAELGGAVAPAVLSGGLGVLTGAKSLAGAAPSVLRMMGYGAGSGAVSAVGTSQKPMSELPEEALMGSVAGAATAGGLGALGKYAVMPGFRALKNALGFGNENKMADLAIARALEKDGLSPYEALAKVTHAQRGDMSLADLGENTAALLRRASQAPGEARMVTKATLSQRELGRTDRVSDDLRSLMSGSKDFHTDVNDLIAKRRADADALYKAAYANPQPINESTAPEINKLRNLPSFQEAMKVGATRAKDKGLDISDPKHTLEALHETKLALDDMISTKMRAGETNQAKTLIDMRNRLVGDMEKASPDYRVARQAFAGDSEMLDAMNMGKTVYQMPEMDMRKAVERFSKNPSEYDAFRAGIAQAMLEKMRAAGPAADPTKSLFARDAEQKLRRAFRDDEAFDQFKNRLMEESQMLKTEKAGFRKTPLDTDLDTGAAGVGAAQNLVHGNIPGAMMNAAQAAFPRVTGMAPGVATATAQKLLTPQTSLDPVMESIMASLKAQQASLAQGAVATNASGALAGGLAAARPPVPAQPVDLGTVGGSPAAPNAPPTAPAPAPLSALTQ